MIYDLPISFGTKPYSGSGDPNLPKHVMRMSAEDRKKWVSTFNSVYKDSDGDEGKAMRIANSVVKK